MNFILKNSARVKMVDVKTFRRMLPNKIVLETVSENRGGRVTKLIKHNG